MKVSVITAVFNRAETIEEAVRSIQRQCNVNIEHIVVDGASTDGTVEILERLSDDRTVLISEPDRGIYDALSKGLAMATGEVVGFMHSDDTFAHNHVLERVVALFHSTNAEAVFGDLDYVSRDNPHRVIRHWKAGEFTKAKLRRGWMPPHPTLYLRRGVIEQLGSFDTSYRIASDYDAILRYFGRGNVRPAYLPEVLVKMRMGGESNQSIRKLIRKSIEDYRALRSNGIGGARALAWKNLTKIGQFIVR